MSDSHKAALAEGREQGRAVRRYLEAIEAHKPKRGRKRTPESVQKRLAIDQRATADADALTRLHLVQERMNLEAELASSDNTVDIQALEDDFVAAAAPYGARKGSPTRRGASWASTPPCCAGPASSGAPTARLGQAGWLPAAASREPRRRRPSSEPRSGSHARSGWGMRPTTLRPAEHTPAMSSTEPFGFVT